MAQLYAMVVSDSIGWHRWQRLLLPADHLRNANNEMRIAQEEIFGPVLTVIPFDTEAEAIRIAERHELWISFWSAYCDIKATRVANAMQAGTCWINCYNIYDVSVPFGGYKASGFGRECGKEVMENYTLNLFGSV